MDWFKPDTLVSGFFYSFFLKSHSWQHGTAKAKADETSIHECPDPKKGRK
jgi:hypothetical protein